MRTYRAIALLIAATAFTAAADPPRAGVAEANGLLQQGKPEAAIQAYRSLQIDNPDSDLLNYNIGCAQLESAPEPNQDEESAAAAELLNSAKASFDKAAMAEDPTIRRDARFNRINCDSQLAKHLVLGGDYKGAVSAFEDVIFDYEDYLVQYPDHDGARQNLNHMRYELKKMLQDPPEEQEQEDQEQGEGEEGQDGEQQDQDGEQEDGDQENESGEEESQGEPQEQQPGDDPAEEQEAGEEQQESGQDSSDEGDPGDESSGESDQQQPGDDQANANGTPGDESFDLPNRETIEAILDALQERDQEEQKNMRRVRQNLPRSNKWW